MLVGYLFRSNYQKAIWVAALVALTVSATAGGPALAQTAATPTPTPTTAVQPTATPPIDAAPTSTPVPAASDPVAPTPTPATQPLTFADLLNTEHTESGGGSNIVQVNNRTNDSFRLRGRVDLDHIQGPDAAPKNKAQAFASCTDCQTFAIALQIALISKDARTVAPVNEAIAVNYQCLRCYTSARAVQYVFQVDDPNAVPDRVTDLIHTMNDELRAIRMTDGMTPAEANARIDAVIAQFVDLAASLDDLRQDTDQPNS